RVPGTDRAGREEHDQAGKLLVHAWRGCTRERGLVLMSRRSGQLEVGSARCEARILERKVDEESLARLAGLVARTRREDRHLHGLAGLGGWVLAGSSRASGGDDNREGDH